MRFHLKVEIKYRSTFFFWTAAILFITSWFKSWHLNSKHPWDHEYVMILVTVKTNTGVRLQRPHRVPTVCATFTSQDRQRRWCNFIHTGCAATLVLLDTTRTRFPPTSWLLNLSAFPPKYGNNTEKYNKHGRNSFLYPCKKKNLFTLISGGD